MNARGGAFDALIWAASGGIALMLHATALNLAVAALSAQDDTPEPVFEETTILAQAMIVEGPKMDGAANLARVTASVVKQSATPLAVEQSATKLAAEESAKTVATEENAEALATEENAEALATDENAEALATDENAETVTTDENAETLATDENAETVTTDENAETLATEENAETVTTDENAETLATDENAETVTTEENAETLETDESAATVAVDDSIVPTAASERIIGKELGAPDPVELVEQDPTPAPAVADSISLSQPLAPVETAKPALTAAKAETQRAVAALTTPAPAAAVGIAPERGTTRAKAVGVITASVAKPTPEVAAISAVRPETTPEPETARPKAVGVITASVAKSTPEVAAISAVRPETTPEPETARPKAVGVVTAKVAKSTPNVAAISAAQPKTTAVTDTPPARVKPSSPETPPKRLQAQANPTQKVAALQPVIIRIPNPVTPDPGQARDGIASAVKTEAVVQAENTYQKVLDFLKGYPAGDCFAALPSLSEDGAFQFEIFARTTDSLSRFRTALESATGTLTGTVMKPISEAQCRALAFVQNSPSYPAFQLYFDLPVREIASGGKLAGRLGNTFGKFVSLVLIDDEGIVQNLESFLRFSTGSAFFEIPMTVQGSPVVTEQLLMALSTPTGLEVVRRMSGEKAEAFFTELTRELQKLDLKEDIALVAFSVH